MATGPLLLPRAILTQQNILTILGHSIFPKDYISPVYAWFSALHAKSYYDRHCEKDILRVDVSDINSHSPSKAHVSIWQWYCARGQVSIWRRVTQIYFLGCTSLEFPFSYGSFGSRPTIPGIANWELAWNSYHAEWSLPSTFLLFSLYSKTAGSV